MNITQGAHQPLRSIEQAPQNIAERIMTNRPALSTRIHIYLLRSRSERIMINDTFAPRALTFLLSFARVLFQRTQKNTENTERVCQRLCKTLFSDHPVCIKVIKKKHRLRNELISARSRIHLEVTSIKYEKGQKGQTSPDRWR